MTPCRGNNANEMLRAFGQGFGHKIIGVFIIFTSLGNRENSLK